MKIETLKITIAMALAVLVSIVAAPNSSSGQEQETEDAQIRSCRELGAAIIPIVREVENDKTAGVDEMVEVDRTTARIAQLDSDAVSLTGPKTAKQYARLVVGHVWFPTGPDVPHQAEAGVVSFCML